MTFSFKPAIRKLASVGLATCILVACHQGTQQGTSAAAPSQPASGQLTQPHSEQTSAAMSAGGGAPASGGSGAGAAANIALVGGPATAGATAAPPTAGRGGTGAAGTTAVATTAAATITARPTATTADIVVGRNDTLDRIFRKLQLNLTDLANLRSLPGIKTHMDNLRLGSHCTSSTGTTRSSGLSAG